MGRAYGRDFTLGRFAFRRITHHWMVDAGA